KYLEQCRTIVEGRAAAIIGDAIEAPLAEADAHRIDAVPETAIPVEPDIGGGVAEIAAALVAMDDLAANEPRPPQHGCRLVDLSFGECHADGTGGNRPIIDIDMRLHVHFDAKRWRLSDQKRR